MGSLLCCQLVIVHVKFMWSSFVASCWGCHIECLSGSAGKELDISLFLSLSLFLCFSLSLSLLQSLSLSRLLSVPTALSVRLRGDTRTQDLNNLTAGNANSKQLEAMFLGLAPQPKPAQVGAKKQPYDIMTNLTESSLCLSCLSCHTNSHRDSRTT